MQLFHVSLWKNGFFRKSFDLRGCGTYVQLFLNMFLDSLTLVHEMVNLFG